MDEVCDSGIIIESDPEAIFSKSSSKQDELPLGDQTVAEVLQKAKEQIRWSLLWAKLCRNKSIDFPTPDCFSGHIPKIHIFDPFNEIMSLSIVEIVLVMRPRIFSLSYWQLLFESYFFSKVIFHKASVLFVPPLGMSWFRKSARGQQSKSHGPCFSKLHYAEFIEGARSLHIVPHASFSLVSLQCMSPNLIQVIVLLMFIPYENIIVRLSWTFLQPLQRYESDINWKRDTFVMSRRQIAWLYSTGDDKAIWPETIYIFREKSGINNVGLSVRS